MSRLSTFLMGMSAGAILLYTAMNFHVLRASDGVHLVAKQSPTLAETFIDVRSFGISDWANHPQLSAALVQAQKQHLLGESATSSITDSVKQLVPAWPNQ
jgi:hypothetical protein